MKQLKVHIKTGENESYRQNSEEECAKKFHEKTDTDADPIIESPWEPKWKQYLATCLASLLSLATGLAGGWSSSANPLLISGAAASDLSGIKSLNVSQASWVVSLLNVGSLASAIPSGHLSSTLGRKGLLLRLAVILILGWICIIWNLRSVWLLYLGRFLCGISAGSVCVAMSQYANEICSDGIRGRAGLFYDFMQCLGVLLAYVMGAITTLYWSSMVCLFVPIAALLTFAWMPESPLYLVKIGQKDEAVKSILWFKGNGCDVGFEISRIEESLSEGHKHDSSGKGGPRCSTISHCYAISYMRSFYQSVDAVTLKAVTIVLAMFMINRSCGAPTIIYYTVDVFQQAHSNISPQVSSILTGASQLLFSFLSILFVDRIGRRILLLFSYFAMTVSVLAFVAYLIIVSENYWLEQRFGWIPASSICLFVGIFRLGVSPIPWFMASELIPTEAQNWALSLVFFTTWGVSFAFSKTYIWSIHSFGYVTVFIFYGIVCILGFFHVLFFVPETKNKTRTQIQTELESRTFVFHS